MDKKIITRLFPEYNENFKYENLEFVVPYWIAKDIAEKINKIENNKNVIIYTNSIGIQIMAFDKLNKNIYLANKPNEFLENNLKVANIELLKNKPNNALIFIDIINENFHNLIKEYKNIFALLPGTYNLVNLERDFYTEYIAFYPKFIYVRIYSNSE